MDVDKVYNIATLVAALLTHLGVQSHEPSALQAVIGGVIANVAVGLRYWLTQKPFIATLLTFLLRVNAIYLVTLFSSIFVYRIFFHRLRSFPGPFWARVTKLWTCNIHLSGEYHRRTQKLHEEYGDIVRVAPNELDINDVQAIKVIYGSGSKFTKGSWYDGPSAVGDTKSIQSEKDPVAHRWRRNIWAQSQGVAAIDEFQPFLLKHIDLFLKKLNESHTIDIGQWFTFLSFDIMGDLAFGESFDTLESGKDHPFMVTLHKFMNTLSIVSAIPWITTLLNVLPASAEIKEFEEISRQQFRKRRSKGSSRKDVFYYLLGEDKETGSKLTEPELVLDARTAIVGGSDTTSIALGCLFYYLVLKQDVYKKLQAEIDVHKDKVLENGWLGQLDYLNACINEGMRLMPPVPQGLQRVVPSSGATLCGKFIPAGTRVSVSPMTVQRDARNFSHPELFIPERWLDGSKETCNKDAYIPFSVGSYGCVGKQLALSEQRLITAAVVRNFDLTFAPDFNVSNFEFSVKNDFTMTPPRVGVSLAKRS